MSTSNPANENIPVPADAPETARGAELKSFPRPADAAAESPAAKPRANRRPLRRAILAGVAVAALAGAGWYGHDWWTIGRFMVSTEDAYIDGNITTVSPKVSGYIATVNVVANQQVKAGDPLITLDDGDYRIAADEAMARIASQQLTSERIDAQIEGARAALAQADAQMQAVTATEANARAARERAVALNAKGHASGASLDAANAAWEQARASLAGAKAGIQAADSNIAVLQAQKAEAESALTSLRLAADKADRDLAFTVLRAPYDGVVGNLAVHEGDLVTAGQRLAALVPVNALYVDANLKETQLARILPGQKVAVSVDAFDGELIEGTVVSVSPASGSVFSLLPANNATGNFTKVVQRVPVRIALPADALASGRLMAGLSVVVDIDTRTAPDNVVRTAAAE